MKYFVYYILLFYSYMQCSYDPTTNEISFWYQIQGSPYSTLEMNEGNIIPLYFFVNGSDFVIGNFARERANLNDPNSYSEYFDIIKDPSKYFTIHGDSKPVKQLIYYGIENFLSHFIKTVLYKNDSIESFRQDFCLRFWFDLDIVEKEKVLIEGLFKDAGYYNACRINYFSAFFESLTYYKTLNSETSLLLLTGLENVLYLQTFKFPSPECIFIEHFEGQGSDPRVKILAEIIIDDIQQSMSYLHLEKEKELVHIFPTVVKLLQNPTPIMSGKAPLSNGNSEYFKVRLKDLNDRLVYYSGFERIYLSIDDIISKNRLSIDKLHILLLGQEINTNYFSEKLLKKYPVVSGQGPNKDESVSKAALDLKLLNPNPEGASALRMADPAAAAPGCSCWKVCLGAWDPAWRAWPRVPPASVAVPHPACPEPSVAAPGCSS